MANRFFGPADVRTPKSELGVRSKGVARAVKRQKRAEARARQEQNIERGYSLKDSHGPDAVFNRQIPHPLEYF